MGEDADDDDDDEDEEDEVTEEVHHHKKHHKAHLKYRHHTLKKNKVKNHTTKHSQKVTLGKSNFSWWDVLTIYTLTSVSIFSILFSIHFLRCWQGEFV